MLKPVASLIASALLVAGANAANSSDFVNSPEHPVLTAAEQKPFTVERYLTLNQDRWVPEAVTMAETAFVVGEPRSPAPYHTVQQAINAALAQHKGDEPIAIKVLPGRYVGTVYIPQDAPAMTIYGAGDDANKVVLSLAIDSMISPQEYQTLVGSQGEYQASDPAWYMYQNCAQTPNKVVTTVCSSVVWSQSDRFTLANLTIENSMLDGIGAGTHQGVALRTDGDKVLLDNVRLLGRQDTFFVNNADKDNQYNTERHTRAYIRNSYIEGDVDYVFGRAQAVFDQVEFHTVSSRNVSSAYVFAPDTLPNSSYGFLVTQSKLSCDSGFTHFAPKLGRAWEQGASKTGYLPGKTANGQLLITQSQIETCYDVNQPWGAAATTNRAFTGNAAKQRDLNDVNHNRLWLYNNKLVKGF